MHESFAPGLHPFWFWNAPLDAATIEAQVAELAAGGCRGVFIHPRQGLQVPYLSQAFFDLVAQTIDACARHGLTPHIYDEFPYPSGMAGGQTTFGHPEFLATELRHHRRECDGGPLRWELPPAELLVCQALPLDEDGPDWDAALDLREMAGSVFTAETWFRGGLSAYTEQRYFAHDPRMVVETELPAGRWLLLASTQERVHRHKYWNDYADVCDPAAMRHFMALTHEAYARHLGPERMARLGCCFIDEVHPGWSRHFPTRYQARFGEALEALLPALACPQHPRHRELKRNYAQLQYEAFVEAFEQPLADWCRSHGLLYVAEKPLLRIDQLRYVDVPGCDAGHRRHGARHDLLGADLRHNTRATASAAQLYDKPGACCEAFHSLGWSATLEDARLLIDNLLLNGIDRIVPHAAFASTHGLRKHDAPPSWFWQRPDWPLFGRLAERIERICARLGRLRHDADLLVIDPALPRHGEAAERYEDLLHGLSATRREFLIVDRSWLYDQRDEHGALDLNGRRITCLIAPLADDDRELESWLTGFAAAGGEVLRGRMPGDAGEGLTVLAGEAADLHQARFRTDAGICHLAVNNGRDELRLRLPSGCAPVDIGDAPLPPSGDELLLPAAASVLLAPEAATAAVPVISAEWPRRWRCRPEGPNLLRLADWQLSIEQDGEARHGAEAVPPCPIGDQIDLAGLPVAYQRQRRFGQSAVLSLPPLIARYRCPLQIAAGCGPLLLVCEPDSLRATRWSIELHGQRFEADDFTSVEAHVPGSLGVSIGELPAGEYELLVTMHLTRDDDGLLAPLYLGGDCATFAEPPGLGPAREEADWLDLDGAGLAHYAGTVLWEAELDLATPEAEEVDLELPALHDDAFELAVGDGPWRAVPWSPRRLRLPRAELGDGRVRCRVRQYTTLGRSFDGERWNAETHRREALSSSQLG